MKRANPRAVVILALVVSLACTGLCTAEMLTREEVIERMRLTRALP